MTDEALSLIDQVVKHAKISHEVASNLLQMGAVYLEKIRTTEDRLVKPGSYLRIHTRPRRYAVDCIEWKTTVVQETSDFVIVNKPPGVPVPSTVDNLQENVTYQLSRALNLPLFVTQRLDRPTSGLLVLAKTKSFQRTFNDLLLNRQVEKRYVALTERAVPVGRYSHYIEDSKSVPKKVAVAQKPGYVTAELEVLSCKGTESEVRLITGRTHQIRAQYSFLGYPLLGDTPYGGLGMRGFHENKIGLRSFYLKFLSYSFQVEKFSDELGNT